MQEPCSNATAYSHSPKAPQQVASLRTMNRDQMFWGSQQGQSFPAHYSGSYPQHHQMEAPQYFGNSGGADSGVRGFSTISPSEFQQACYFMEKMITAEESKRDSSTLLLQNPANAQILPVLAALQKNFYSHAPDSMDSSGMGRWGVAQGHGMGSYGQSDKSEDPHSFAQKAQDLW